MISVNDKWANRLLNLTVEVSSWSKDPVAKVGAVIVKDNRVIGMGYNGFPKGVPDNCKWLENPELKNQVMIHAELNAILNTSNPSLLHGSTIYVSRAPCIECAKAIIQSGIKEVVAPKIHEDSKWFHSCAHADKLFYLASIKRTYHE